MRPLSWAVVKTEKAPVRVPYVSGSPRTAGILKLSYLDAFIPRPGGGNPSFYPDNPHYTEVIPTPATVSVMRGRGQVRRTKKANPVRAHP